MCSGEELELWLLKTAFGLYYSGNFSKDRHKLRESQSINIALMQTFQGLYISAPCGMHIMNNKETAGPRPLDVTPLLDDSNERMVGLRLGFWGLSLLLLIDPLTSYGEPFLASLVYRPSYILFRNRHRKRTHTIALTWPPNSPANAFIYEGIGLRRSPTVARR